MTTPKLVASSKPGEHKVKIYKKRYVKTFVYARIRKMTFVEPPTYKQFMSSIFRLAHDMLQRNAQQEEEE